MFSLLFFVLALPGGKRSQSPNSSLGNVQTWNRQVFKIWWAGQCYSFVERYLLFVFSDSVKRLSLTVVRNCKYWHNDRLCNTHMDEYITFLCTSVVVSSLLFSFLFFFFSLLVPRAQVCYGFDYLLWPVKPKLVPRTFSFFKKFEKKSWERGWVVTG